MIYFVLNQSCAPLINPMLCNDFHMLLDLACWYYLMDLYVNIHEGCESAGFFCVCGAVFVCFWFRLIFAAAAESRQSCPTLCDPIDGSPSGSPVPGILQARTLEWVAISFSNAWKWKVKVKSLSHVRLLVTPWTAAHQAPPSMGFSRQEYWSGVPLPANITYIKLNGNFSLLFYFPEGIL